jgi:hypothetical protein
MCACLDSGAYLVLVWFLLGVYILLLEKPLLFHSQTLGRLWPSNIGSPTLSSEPSLYPCSLFPCSLACYPHGPWPSKAISDISGVAAHILWPEPQAPATSLRADQVRSRPRPRPRGSGRRRQKGPTSRSQFVTSQTQVNDSNMSRLT